MTYKAHHSKIPHCEIQQIVAQLRKNNNIYANKHHATTIGAQRIILFNYIIISWH